MIPSTLHSTSSLRIAFILAQNRIVTEITWTGLISNQKSNQSRTSNRFRQSVTILSSDPGATMLQCRDKQNNSVQFISAQSFKVKYRLRLNFYSTGSFWLRLIKTTCSPSITSLCGTAWPWKTRLEASSTTPSTTKVGLLGSSVALSFSYMCL